MHRVDVESKEILAAPDRRHKQVPSAGWRRRAGIVRESYHEWRTREVWEEVAGKRRSDAQVVAGSRARNPLNRFCPTFCAAGQQSLSPHQVPAPSLNAARSHIPHGGLVLALSETRWFRRI